MQPVTRETASRGSGLGDLVLMVREAQIETATVDVEGVAQVAVRHRGALEVPTGTAPAERGRPRGGGRFTGLARLPQREVVRVALPGALAVVGRAEVLEPLMSELAVPREGPVSYTHLRAHETRHDLVCRLLLEK